MDTSCWYNIRVISDVPFVILTIRGRMLHCPHCHATITHSELLSKRLLTPRTCRACGGGYFEGGTTAGIGLVSVGGALATSVGSCHYLPAWAPLPIAFGAAALATLYTHLCQPRKVEELRSRIVAALITVPVVAIIVLMVLQAVK